MWLAEWEFRLWSCPSWQVLALRIGFPDWRPPETIWKLFGDRAAHPRRTEKTARVRIAHTDVLVSQPFEATQLPAPHPLEQNPPDRAFFRDGIAPVPVRPAQLPSAIPKPVGVPAPWLLLFQKCELPANTICRDTRRPQSWRHCFVCSLVMKRHYPQRTTCVRTLNHSAPDRLDETPDAVLRETPLPQSRCF